MRAKRIEQMRDTAEGIAIAVFSFVVALALAAIPSIGTIYIH